MGIPIHMIQVNNGSELVNDVDVHNEKVHLRKPQKTLNMELKKIRLY